MGNSLRTARAGNWEELSQGSFNVKVTPKFQKWLRAHGVKGYESFPEMTELHIANVTWKIRGKQTGKDYIDIESNLPPENPSNGTLWLKTYDPANRYDNMPDGLYEFNKRNSDNGIERIWIPVNDSSTFYAKFKLDYDVYIGGGKSASPTNYRGSVGNVAHRTVAEILHPAWSHIEVMKLIAKNSIPEFEFRFLNDDEDSDDSVDCSEKWLNFAHVGNGQFNSKFFEATIHETQMPRPEDLDAFLAGKNGNSCSVAWDMRMSKGGGDKDDAYILHYSIDSDQMVQIDSNGQVTHDGIHVCIDGDGHKGMIICEDMARKILVGHSRRILEPLLSRHNTMPSIIIGDPESKTWNERLAPHDFEWVHDKDHDLDKYSMVKRSPLD